MKNQLQISNAFRVYKRKMNNIYSELYSVKESVSNTEYQILLEGFWDKLKSAASGVGSFLGKTTKSISNFSKDVYNKGVELGKKALEVGKELVNKISEVAKNTVAAIKSAPGKLMDACKDLYSSVSNEVGEIWNKAKEKGGDWLANAKQTIINMYNKISENLKDGIVMFKNWATKNIEEFKKMVAEKKNELSEASESAIKSSNETVKKIGEGIKSFFQKAGDVSKNVGLFAIGLVVLPFYGSYLLMKKTYELGDEAAEYLKNGIESIKKNVPEVWAEFTKGFETASKPAVTERHFIKTFENFKY